MSVTPCALPGGLWATEPVMLHVMATHAAFALGHTEAIHLLRTSCHFWMFYELCPGNLYGIFFFLSLCNLFLVSFLWPCEETIPGWSRCTSEFLAVTYQRWRTAWKVDYLARQLTSSAGRERLSGSALVRQVDGAWGGGSVYWPPCSPDLTHIDLYPWRYVGNQPSCLGQHLLDRWMGRGGSLYWPPRSPDLTHMDLYLWRHVGNQAIIIIKQNAWNKGQSQYCCN